MNMEIGIQEVNGHYPPATGRDDDINKLREVLDDILVKTGQSTLDTT